MEKPEGKRRLGKRTLGWENNTKWIFDKLVGGIDLIDVAQDRDRWRAVVIAVLNLRVP